MSKKTITHEEHEELYFKVDNEGFEYYMLHYGPDIDLICKLGFEKEKVLECLELLRDIESAIYSFDE